MLATEFTRLGIDPEKTTAKAPTQPENAAFDLTAEVLYPGGDDQLPLEAIELVWTERCIGDYDQNGEVNIADLTPLGYYFGKDVVYDEPSAHNGIVYWPGGDPDDGGIGSQNWRRARVDGDSNGEINISDLTPVALHWLERLDGYRVYRKAPDEGVFSLLQLPGDPGSPISIERPGSAPQSTPVRLFFDDTEILIGGVYYYYVAPYDIANSDEGPASVVIQVNISLTNTPVAIIEADHDNGRAPLEVSFHAGDSYVSGGTIEDYEWDLDGDGTFNEPGVENSRRGHYTASYIYTSEGVYKAAVRVTDNNSATDIASIDITVTSNAPPDAVIEASVPGGTAMLHVTFNAGESTAAEGGVIDKYEWDFDDDGEFDWDSGGSPVADFYYYEPGTFQTTVRVTDNHGLFDTAAVPVTVTAGAVWHVQHIETLPVGVNIAPAIASVSGSPAVCYNGANITEPYSKVILKFQRASDEYGAQWDTPVAVDFRSYDAPTMQVINGVPMIAYDAAAPPNGQLRCVRAVDSLGVAWEDPVTVLFSDNASYPDTQFAIAGGNPAIAYMAGSETMFLVSVDLLGENWNDPIEVDCRGNLRCGNINTIPAIAYIWDSSVLYSQGLDSSANDWSAPTVVAFNSVDSDDHPSMACVDNRPAVAYRSGPLDNLVYQRASNLNGTGWDQPEVLDSSISSKHTMVIIDERPAVFYEDPSEGVMRFIAASDTSGYHWSFPIVVDVTDIATRGFPSAADVNGTPVVAYLHYDAGVYSIRMATYY